MKFRLKITFCMLALLSILFGIGGSVLIVSSFQDTMRQEKVTAENTYKMLQYTLQISGVQKLLSETGDIRNVIGQSIRQNGGYWDDILLTADGKEIYSSGKESAFLRTRDSADTKEYPEEGKGSIVSVRDENGENNLCVTGTFTAGDRRFSLTAARDISDLYRNRNRMQELYRIVFAVLMLLCAVLAYSMALFLTAPLSRLAQGSAGDRERQLCFPLPGALR